MYEAHQVGTVLKMSSKLILYRKESQDRVCLYSMESESGQD